MQVIIIIDKITPLSRIIYGFFFKPWFMPLPAAQNRYFVEGCMFVFLDIRLTAVTVSDTRAP